LKIIYELLAGFGIWAPTSIAKPIHII